MKLNGSTWWNGRLKTIDSSAFSSRFIFLFLFFVSLLWWGFVVGYCEHRPTLFILRLTASFETCQHANCKFSVTTVKLVMQICASLSDPNFFACHFFFFFLLYCSSSYPPVPRRCLTCEIQEFRTSSPSARLVPGRQPQLCSALSSAVEKELKNRSTRSKNIDIITPLFSPTNQRPGSDDSIIDSQITIEPSWGIVGNRSNKLRKHHLKNRLSFCLTLDATAHTGLHPTSINWNSMAVLVYVISIKFEANKAIGLDRFSTWS